MIRDCTTSTELGCQSGQVNVKKRVIYKVVEKKKKNISRPNNVCAALTSAIKTLTLLLLKVILMMMVMIYIK